jgi:ribonuclease D
MPINNSRIIFVKILKYSIFWPNLGLVNNTIIGQIYPGEMDQLFDPISKIKRIHRFNKLFASKDENILFARD